MALVAQEKFSEPREVEVILLNSLLFQFIACLCLILECAVTKFVMYVYFIFFQKVVITPVKKELGLAFKGNQKMVVEALEVILKDSFSTPLC